MLHHNNKLDLSMDAHKHFLFQNNLLCVLYIDRNNCGVKFFHRHKFAIWA